jgi:uncharacterized protein (DUF1778 family)
MKDDILKLRLSSEQKAQLRKAADREGLALSSLVRRASLLAAKGRIGDEAIRTDMLAIRRAMNGLEAHIDAFATATPEAITQMRALLGEVRKVASIYVTAAR